MTTIKQLSDDLGVSKQAIYNRITKEPLKTVLADIEGAVQTNAQGTIFLSDEGERIIRNAYEEKYRRPGEAPKQFNQPFKTAAVPPTRVEFDDSKLDSILLQISNMQASLYTLTQQLSVKDAQINSLNTQLEERGIKNQELSRTAKKLTEFATAKDAEIQVLKEKCTAAEAQAAKLQRQILDLESEIIIGDTNEPDPDPPPAAYDHQPDEPTEEPTEEPEIENVPPEQESVEKNLFSEIETMQTSRVPDLDITDRPSSLFDLYEPLSNLSNDLSKPTMRFSSNLAVKE